MNTNNNGKWRLAFWVMSVLCGTWLAGLTHGVIANDRIRVNEEKEIRAEIFKVQQNISDKLEVILERLARIEAKLENE